MDYDEMVIDGLTISEWRDIEDEKYIAHYGVGHDENPPGRGSGRYPWGQGNRKHQHDWDLKARIDKLSASGMTDREIAAQLGYFQTDSRGNVITDKDGNPKPSTGTLKAIRQMASNAVKQDEGEEINWYYHNTNPDTGKPYTPTEIGKILGINESSVRTKYKTYLTGNANKVTETANRLKDEVKKKGYVDVGSGAELSLGVSPDRLNTALAMLQQEGYTVDNIRIKQQAGNNKTTYRVLAAPGTTTSDIYKHKFEIRNIEDNGGTEVPAIMKGEMDPAFVDLSRVDIRYAEQKGTAKDGEIEIRAVVGDDGKLHAASPDLDLGSARYAQVRIAVDGGKECQTEKNPEGMKYIKGMAVLSTEVPDRYDILVNSNKSIKDGPKEALKDLKMGDTNPFGSTVVQTQRVDKDGKPMFEKNGKPIYSAINLVGTDIDDAHKEGEWGGWSKNLPSQFLSKQSLGLVTQQLKLKAKQSEDELADIEKLNNPVVKKKILLDYADQCDSDAVTLKAAPIGGQGVKVLLPITSLKDNECYCPSLPNGTQVALVRFPHAGPFEIPICKVNNSNKEGKIFAGDGRDMVGINQHTASKLSGADFDGDTAIVIPMTRKNKNGEFEKAVDIKSAPSLPGLDGFDPTASYSVKNDRFKNMVDKDGNPTFHVMTEQEKGIEMGVVSNLITDMYAKGCDKPEELADAVRYSMVVIDAKKHKLNYEQAYQDYDIERLKKKYQMKPNGKYGGASSLLSQSKSKVMVDARQPKYDIDPETGEKIFRPPTIKTEADRQRVKVIAPDGYTWTDDNGKLHKHSKYMKDPHTGKDIYATEDGKIVKNKDGTYSYDRGKGQDIWATIGYKKRQQESTKMYEAKDASELLSTNPNEIEKAYRDYANHMKALGNRARKEAVAIEMPKKDPEAAKRYSEEVASLQDKLIQVKKNRPLERQANLLATQIVNGAYEDHPDWDKDDKRKARGQAVKAARKAIKKTTGKDLQIKFTEKEWEAVNNNAVSPNFLSQLLDKADQDNYMQLAMPKQNRISDAKRSRIKALYNAGWSYEEIAKSVGGVSISSIGNIVNE